MFSRHAWGFEELSIWRAMPFDYEKSIDLWEDSPQTRAEIWAIAAGLQELSGRGSEVSPKLMEIAQANIDGTCSTKEAVGLIELHHWMEDDDGSLSASGMGPEQARRRLEIGKNDKTAQADVMCARIVDMVARGKFEYSPSFLCKINAQLLDGLLDSAPGEFRMSDIRINESILGGNSVSFSSWQTIPYMLESDFADFDYVRYAEEEDPSDEDGLKLAMLVSNIWQIHPFEKANTCTLAVFLLMMLKSWDAIVSPEAFAEHSTYFRKALVRANYANAKLGIAENYMFLDKFLANFLMGDEFVLDDGETRCIELLGMRAVEARDPRASGVYVLKMFDTPIASFRIEKSYTGDFLVSGLALSDRHANLLPVNFAEGNYTYDEVSRFIKARVMSRNRSNRGEILGSLGIAGARNWAMMHACKGISVNDSYSVVLENDESTWIERSPYDNAPDSQTQLAALCGKTIKRAVGDRDGLATELTTSGSRPKAWRLVKPGRLVLYKAADTRRDPKSVLSPYSEYLSSQILSAANVAHVNYELDVWHDLLCSASDLFNTSLISYIPYGLMVSGFEIKDPTLSGALEYYRDLGPDYEEGFRNILVLDALMANGGRNIRSHGVMRSNTTGEAVGLAPAFNYDQALFSTREIDLMSANEMSDMACDMPGAFELSLFEQAVSVAGNKQLQMLKSMRGFAFEDDGVIREFGKFDGVQSGAHGKFTTGRLGKLESYLSLQLERLIEAIEIGYR